MTVAILIVISCVSLVTVGAVAFMLGMDQGLDYAIKLVEKKLEELNKGC